MNSSPPCTSQKDFNAMLTVLDLDRYLGTFPTYKQFTKLFSKQALEVISNLMQLTYAMGYDPQIEALTFVEILHASFIVKSAGSRVFILSPEIIQLLKDTDIPDSPIEFLQLPFEGIIIQVKKGTFTEPFEYVTSIMLTCLQNDRFRIAFSHQDGETGSFMNIAYEEDMTIREAIEFTRVKCQPGKASYSNSKHDWESYEETTQTGIFQFGVNVALYLSSPDVDVFRDMTAIHKWHTQLQGLKKKKQKRQVLENELQKAKDTYIYLVGSNIDLEGYEDVRRLENTSEGKKLLHQHRVRGHWKTILHGKRRQKKKLGHIRPYYRGPTFAETINKLYRVS